MALAASASRSGGAIVSMPATSKLPASTALVDAVWPIRARPLATFWITGMLPPSVVMPNAYWSPGSNRALRPSVGCSTVAHFVNRRAEGLKHGVGAMRMPVDTRLSNWASMVMTALAWTLKAWVTPRLPEAGRWAARDAAEKAAVLRMEFNAFLNVFMRILVQVVRTSRRFDFPPGCRSPAQSLAVLTRRI